MAAAVAHLPGGTPIALWWQDEMRLGQKNGTVRQWARAGTRPRQPADQRYKNTYLFGAIYPAEGSGAALVMLRADTRAMQPHLKEISRNLTPGAHAVLLLDRAGWHTTSKLSIPNNVSLVFLPPRLPELCTKWTRSGNLVENVWQYLRQTHLANRVFETYGAILDAAANAWNRLIEKPYKIMSLGLRPWAYTGHHQ